MTWSGVAISASDAPRTVSIGGTTLLTLFPEVFFREFSLPVLPVAMAWHFAFAWLLFLNGAIYLLWTIGSGSWRDIAPDRSAFPDACRVLRGKPSSPADRKRKYNGAQRLAYPAAIAMGTGLVVTGLAIFRPIQLAPLVSLLGGYQAARTEHFWLTMAMIGFVVVHVIQALGAGWNTLRGMIVGVEVVPDAEAVP
jgi:thiosulfate reductase cytochrome b subunit